MYKKGQAAMEYLMTYGWAILVIVIVLAILAAILPQLAKTPESCLFSQTGFSCNDLKPAIVADSSNQVYTIISLSNQQGQVVNVNRTLCTTGSLGNVNKDATYVTQVPAANRTVAAGGSMGYTINCYTQNGDRVVMTPGSDFRGLVVVWYNFQNEVSGAPLRQASAVLTGTVLKQ